MEHRQRDVEDKDSLCGGDTLVSRLGGLCDQSPWADCTGPKVAHDHSLEVAQEGKRLGAKGKTRFFIKKKGIWSLQFLILGFTFLNREYLTP